MPRRFELATTIIWRQSPRRRRPTRACRAYPEGKLCVDGSKFDYSCLRVIPGGLSRLRCEGKLAGVPRPYREDPQILEHIQAALQRGVRVRAIVDRGKYDALASEQANLVHYLTSAGGQLHLEQSGVSKEFSQDHPRRLAAAEGRRRLRSIRPLPSPGPRLDQPFSGLDYLQPGDGPDLAAAGSGAEARGRSSSRTTTCGPRNSERPYY